MSLTTLTGLFPFFLEEKEMGQTQGGPGPMSHDQEAAWPESPVSSGPAVPRVGELGLCGFTTQALPTPPAMSVRSRTSIPISNFYS